MLGSTSVLLECGDISFRWDMEDQQDDHHGLGRLLASNSIFELADTWQLKPGASPGYSPSFLLPSFYLFCYTIFNEDLSHRCRELIVARFTPLPTNTRESHRLFALLRLQSRPECQYFLPYLVVVTPYC